MEQKGQRDMLIFDELWNGAFSPCEHRYERNSDYDVVSRRISAQMDVLRQNASKRQKKVWEAYDRDLAERENLEQQDAYYQGIRFGARFMLDTFLSDDAPFESFLERWHQRQNLKSAFFRTVFLLKSVIRRFCD